VSLDAQDWVWNHSQSKGTARLVLLAIADKAYGKGCTAYAGTTMLVQRSNAARSSVIGAVDKLIELGELAVVTGQQGPRGETVYTLPKARRHRRSAPEGGPDSGPVQIPDRSEIQTGTDFGPEGSENRTGRGPDSGPHNGKNTNTYLPPTAVPNSATPHEPAGAEQDQALAAAIAFLQNLSAPWTVGRVTAKALAPDLLDVIAEQGWQLDDTLAAKLTENPNGINNHRSVLRIRIGDLPKAPAQPAHRGPTLPRWCGNCGDGNPAAEFNAKFRLETGSKKPCPNCHPTHHAADAA
jgi:hypothetical protein